MFADSHNVFFCIKNLYFSPVPRPFDEHRKLSLTARTDSPDMLALRSLSRNLRSGMVLAERTFPNTLMQHSEEIQSNQHRGVTSDVYDVGSATNIKFHDGMVPRETKEKLMNQRGVVIWFTGLSGSGKSTVACTLEHALAARGKVTVLLDGDNVRHGLNSNLGFTAEDREENIRRIGEVSKLFAESGVITLTSFISPYKTDRAKVRARMAKDDFMEVFMRIPIEICEERDPKGLYKAARAGKIKNFTGIDDPYEEPENPEITLDAKDKDGKMASAEDMAAEIISYLDKHGYLKAP